MAKDIALLKKAGLRLNGVVEIKAFVSGDVRKVINTTIGELENTKTGKRVIDHRNDTVFFYALRNPMGGIAGDWRRGLTKDEREYLGSMYNLPYFNIKHKPSDPETTHRLIVNNLRFDLSVPSEAAWFKLLSTSKSISSCKENCSIEQSPFYWSTKESRVLAKKKKRDLKLKAFKLIEQTTATKKQDIIKLMILDGVFSTEGEEFSIDDYVSTFDDKCLEDGKLMLNYTSNKLYKELLIIKSLTKSRVIFNKKDIYYARNPITGSELEMGATFQIAASKVNSIEFGYLKDEYKKLQSAEEDNSVYRANTALGFNDLFDKLSAKEEDDSDDDFDEATRKIKYSKKPEKIIEILNEIGADFNEDLFLDKSLAECKGIAYEIVNKYYM